METDFSDLDDASRDIALLLFSQAIADGASALRVGPPPSDAPQPKIDGWPPNEHWAFYVAVQYPDGKWYEYLPPPVNYREAILRHLRLNCGRDWEAIEQSNDGPVTFRRRPCLGSPLTHETQQRSRQTPSRVDHMEQDLSTLVISLHKTIENYALVILRTADIADIKVGLPEDKPIEFQMDNWPPAANWTFDIAVRFSGDEQWYQMVSPGSIFRHALLRYLRANADPMFEVLDPTNQGPVNFRRRQTT
ncbi:MAG: hypothetical protein NTW19_13340 [Planctomycetota bacterium]|nr:hypothetical protein [Planctomycetota bacterium]